MDDHEDNPNNIISRINENYTKPNFILYAPPPQDINNKTSTNPNYYKNIETFFRTNPGIFNVSNLAINQLKLEYTTFLLIDGENLLYRLKDFYGFSNITDVLQNHILEILQPYYAKNICIIIFCQQHNMQPGSPYYNIDQKIDKANIILFKFNNILLSRSEVDDIMLMYFYIAININPNYRAHVLTFDRNTWFKPVNSTPLTEHKLIYDKFFNEVKTLTENKNLYDLKKSIKESAKSITVMPAPKNPPILIRKYSLKSRSSSSNSSSTSKSSRGRSRSSSRRRRRKQNTKKRSKFPTHRTKHR